jgi:hypothetical protein
MTRSYRTVSDLFTLRGSRRIGSGNRADATQPQFLDEPVPQRRVCPFDTPLAGLLFPQNVSMFSS